ncbi:MAG: histidine phosphatase family protein [Planctomycetaceae bacterium]|nr:histidine phosphatase family protein [Planctomycetaceae bacterium]
MAMSPGERCRMFLVRHGATANNEAHPPRLQGCRSDAELSAIGRRQAEQAAALLHAESIQAVYASPLRRARETAAAIARPHCLEVALVEGLTECDVGDWEGRSWSEIERDDPERFRRFIEDSAIHPYAGGESLDQVRDRVAPVFRDLGQRHRGGAIVIVAHNVVNRVALAHWLGWPIAKARGIPQSNCGVNLIDYADDKFTVVTINGAFHL